MSKDSVTINATQSEAILQSMKLASSQIVEIDGNGCFDEVHLAIDGAFQTLAKELPGHSVVTDAEAAKDPSGALDRANIDVEGEAESDGGGSDIALALDNFEIGVPKIDGETASAGDESE